MRKLFLQITLILITQISFAQIIETRIQYYKNTSFNKEVSKEKAKFSETNIIYADSSKTTEIKDLEKDYIIYKTSYKNQEPIGVWIEEEDGKIINLDYNFNLQECYLSDCCEKKTKQYYAFENIDSLNYIAPKVKNDNTSIQYYISSVLTYPELALDLGIHGMIVLNFVINEEGKIENIRIIKKCNPLLDKEAVRVLRKLECTPPTLNGEKIKICVNIPIVFKLN